MSPHSQGSPRARHGGSLVISFLVASVAVPRTFADVTDEPSCLAGQVPGEGCLLKKVADGDTGQNSSCQERGFNPEQLTCKTCKILEQRIQEAGSGGKTLFEECYDCCQETAEVEKFSVARLIADASSQDKDQDLHDFIKRKAPFFPALEVEYQEGAKAAIEFEKEEDPSRIVRADVSGWQSDHLFQFLTERLEESSTSASGPGIVQGAWTAEIQTCSGWRLNQLPEVRRFIKEPGHADTYAGLKVNFIPHHNPDLVFFNEHGEEKERLDLGRYNTVQIHKLIQDKGFKKKRAKTFRGEIRTCSGWRLNQLPEVRKFVLGAGNADSYIGLKINFIPHHSPVLVILGGSGNSEEEIDIAPYSFDGLHSLLKEHGFQRKELL